MSRVRVSDHALLRWLERVEGVDLVALRHRITKAVQRGAEERAEGVRIDGVTFKLAYNPGETVVTTTVSPRTRPHLAQPRTATAAEEEGE